MYRYLTIYVASLAMLFSVRVASAKKAPFCKAALAKCHTIGALTATGKAGFAACMAGLKRERSSKSAKLRFSAFTSGPRPLVDLKNVSERSVRVLLRASSRVAPLSSRVSLV
jgi:hypothetical protein